MPSEFGPRFHTPVLLLFLILIACHTMAFKLLHPPEKFLEVLRVREDELVSALGLNVRELGLNVRELCDKFFERCLLSSESHAHFISLDHSRLKPQLQVRYLVRLVSERAKTDPALGHNLIEVLDTLEGVPSSLTDELKRAVAANVQGFTEGSSITGVSPVTVEEIVFTEEDLRRLAECLVKVTPKWQLVALSLEIPPHEIDCIKDSCLKSCLCRCIKLWLARANPSLKKLKAALCSKLVNELHLAESLQELLQEEAEKTNKATKLNPKHKKVLLFPRIVGQSLPTEVADGKSILLQVQARPRESVDSYQWNKDGQPLANSSRYSGVDEDILVVRHASQGTEGKYTCCVILQDKQVTSDPITLTVHFSLAKNLLLNLYSKLKEVPTSMNDWPPVVAKSFINLAIVKASGDLNKEIKLSVSGDVDSIIAVKEKIEYNEIFSKYRSSELILVEGRPGSGKTTLVHKIVEDWVAGNVLVKARLTFLISPFQSKAITLSSFLQDFFINEEDLKQTVANMVSSAGEGVCFIIDDFDKCWLSEKCSVVLKLVNKVYLPKAMIILSSRPNATLFLNEALINKRIEVIGFSKWNISEYIDNFPFYEDDGASDCSITRASQLKDYLRYYPNVLDMCYLPVHAAMICFLFQFAENITSTQTKVYEEFTRLMICRHLARYKNYTVLFSLKDLDGQDRKCFKDLCCLAYEMTIKSKQVISSQELQVQLGGSSISKEGGLGLLTIVTTLDQTGIHESYAFLHSTFQEFLAAYYIVNYMNQKQQVNVLQQYHSMKTVWRFYSGMVSFERPDCVRLKELLKSSSDLEPFYYALESGKKIVCDSIVERKSGSFFFPALTPSDMKSIFYALETSYLPVNCLAFACCTYDEKQLVSLLNYIKKANIYFLDTLDIDFQICDNGTKVLCEVLECTKNSIDNLVLNIKHCLPCSVYPLVKVISDCTNLSKLNISYAGTSECIMSFVSSLKCCLKYLCLLFDGLDQQSIKALGKGCVSLRPDRLDLKISASYFDKDNLSLLVGNLQHVQSLHLDLSRNGIDGSIIAQMACKGEKTGLRRLSFSSNSIGPAGATSLAEGLQFMSGLEELDLSHNNIGPAGASAIAKELERVTGLSMLDLSHNNIGPAGASAIAKELKSVSELKRLDISHNAIGFSGATELVNNLRLVPDLEYINLVHNDVERSETNTIETSLNRFENLLWVLNTFDSI